MDPTDSSAWGQAPDDCGTSETAPKLVKTRRDIDCFAPSCKSCYRHWSEGSKFLLFSAQRGLELFQKWDPVLHHADQKQQLHWVVCERYFEEHLIIFYFIYVVNGAVVKVPKEHPCLASSTVASILPNTPAYLTKKFLKREWAKLQQDAGWQKSPR